MTKPTCCIPASPTPASPTSAKGSDVGPMREERRGNGEVPTQLVAVPGGRALVGSKRPVHDGDGESPSRTVGIAAFRIDPHAVTNERFARFVAQTGYRTDAERLGWSLVFAPHFEANGQPGSDVERLRVPDLPWWLRVEGADWSHPNGPHSAVDAIAEHPAVHVSWNDACAFADWAGGRLPTEAEWECAARGGPEGKGSIGDVPYPWGREEPGDEPEEAVRCNIWQGRFPVHDSGADGWAGTAPVDAFAPNALGLHNMVGNVWEWCADAFRIRSRRREARQRNEHAARNGERVLKGGSFLCHRSYCHRYRIAARTGASANSSTAHTGMRIVASH